MRIIRGCGKRLTAILGLERWRQNKRTDKNADDVKRIVVERMRGYVVRIPRCLAIQGTESRMPTIWCRPRVANGGLSWQTKRKRVLSTFS